MTTYSRRLLASLLLLASSTFAAERARIDVRTDQPGASINPSMWGVFFEDINFGADGGLYAELVKNGSFEFPDPRTGWKKLGDKQVDDRIRYQQRDGGKTPANQRYVDIHGDGTGTWGLVNEGFRGIGVRVGENYDFSVEMRSASNGLMKLRVELINEKGVLAAAEIEGGNSNWRRFTATLVPKATEAKASLRITAIGLGHLQVDRVSLFPRNTWKNRVQGLRADMVQALADMKPGFIRFPGGCIVEGPNLALRYQWKKTILPKEERELLFNRWNTEMKDRQAPDYYQSFGLGFFEYFQLCEDLGAQPLPIINCGMACQFNSAELVPLEDLQPYIQDALDLIEFANGPVTSEWGAKRAALGHPAPFNMKLLGVGNEQWGPQYVERFDAFAKALKASHPEIELIAAAGPSPSDARFQYLWQNWRQLNPDYVDEHSYSPPAWFIEAFNRYDAYSRQGPRVFVGEYAAHTKGNRNNLEAALAEAVFMLGLERNADQVRLAAYAPLFAHVDAWQWRPDLIWVDNLRVMPTPNYFVQQLFSLNRGSQVLPTALSDAKPGSLFASASLEESSGEVIVKVVNPTAQPVEAVLSLEGRRTTPALCRRIQLSGATPSDENTLEQPAQVSPKTEGERPFDQIQTFAPYSFTILRIR